jgi:hypothetical protein
MMRWRKKPLEKGFGLKFFKGAKGYELCDGDDVLVRVVWDPGWKSVRPPGWFFVGDIDGERMNTCDTLVSQVEEAKENADAWVRKVRPPRGKR